MTTLRGGHRGRIVVNGNKGPWPACLDHQDGCRSASADWQICHWSGPSASFGIAMSSDVCNQRKIPSLCWPAEMSWLGAIGALAVAAVVFKILRVFIRLYLAPSTNVRRRTSPINHRQDCSHHCLVDSLWSWQGRLGLGDGQHGWHWEGICASAGQTGL